MKAISFSLKLALLATVTAAILFTACERTENLVENPAQELIETSDLLHKDILVSDDKGLNMVSLRVLSNDATQLEQYDDNTFELIIGKTKASNNQASMSENDGLTTPESIDEQGDYPEVHVVVLEEHFQDADADYTLRYRPSTDTEKAFCTNNWRYCYFYSTKDCVDVVRKRCTNLVWIYYKNTSSSSWSNIAYEVLDNGGESVSRCRYNSYKLKVKVKTRHETNVDVYFHN